ncbi:hypothetical protein AS200_14205 [Streptomyces sp. CdTB01]|nr:hypothetical protein AS200_14205 [Streptomyces sp. CdTB01]
MRSGGHTEADLEAQLNAGGGVMTRTLGRATRVVGKPWHMYPPGFLFGLGFDTATEVSLLFLAAGAAGSGIPWYAILCLPVLFAAGMSLLDTIDGSFVNFAYSWAFSNPVRKVFYNITITGLSVAAASSSARWSCCRSPRRSSPCTERSGSGPAASTSTASDTRSFCSSSSPGQPHC